MSRQGDERQRSSSAALAEDHLHGSGFADAYGSHQAEDLGAHERQNRDAVIAAGSGHGPPEGARATAHATGTAYGLLPGGLEPEVTTGRQRL